MVPMSTLSGISRSEIRIPECQLDTLIVFRAGVVEELFYRGYAIERLQALGLNRYWAAAILLIIFALGHWTGGAANVVIAVALGGILAGFYLWRRDLIANMIGHFAVDFVANVLPKLFSWPLGI